MISIDEKYFSPTAIIDSNHYRIKQFAGNVIADTRTKTLNKAVKLYYAVRDGIWYDPYYPFYLPEHYQASRVLEAGRGFCVSKASLLCALGRACGIASRVGFATVRNHLATKQLVEMMGCNLFVYHGYTEFFLDGKWVKATPAFNIELCKKHKVKPLEFNGQEDSIFHAYTTENKLFMEYVEDHGSYADIPVETIVSAWKKAYGSDRVNLWIEAIKKSGGKSMRDFYAEDLIVTE